MKKTYMAPVVRVSGFIVGDTLCGPVAAPSEYGPGIYRKAFAGSVGLYL